MNLNRRDFFKTGGYALGAIGLSQMLTFKAHALDSAPDVDVYAFHCGVLKTKTQYLLKNTRIGVPFDVPVPFFLIRHGSSWIAFDTGNNAAVAIDPEKYWGKAICDAYTPVMKPHEAFKVQIKKLGLKPADLKAVIMSHGHLDHCGALEDLSGTGVPVYIQEDELSEIKKQIATGKKTAYIPEDFKMINTVNIQPKNGLLDIFGDSTVVLFPTPGHTVGHQSIFVRTSDGQSLILAQDACYTLENLTASIPPGLAYDIPASMVNIYHFRTMSIMGAHLVPPHDPDFWKGKPLAPQKFII
ncbi:N-acyl homoserine lactonase AttM [Desulfosarcina widdelii]|uniref:N-acyl homoserine lactonase AttM n=1 Tax=Desulfosarcina widdelii TaxID=947919 RepID=A0A5K7YYZ4_9BACT|nr:N-acyl homoserine lactonase family protein [Desulfosarcina widdelii]BBO74616.1 N-acyl homoserine lactonase AttM [Desulfosarcina widdelii]